MTKAKGRYFYKYLPFAFVLFILFKTDYLSFYIIH